jgi:hypothetical protein
VLEIDDIMIEIQDLLIEKYGISDELTSDLIKFQRRTIVGYWEQEDVEINHNLPEVMSGIMLMHPLQRTIDKDLRKEKIILKSNQKQVGSFNKLIRKVDISDIKDYDSWIHSRIHEGRNLRASVNYYNEVLECRSVDDRPYIKR